MKYILYKYDEANGMWYTHAHFDNKDELIHFLSFGTHTHNSESRRRWSNQYFDEQNLTLNDILVWDEYVRAYDRNGDPAFNQWGPLYDHREHRKVRPWHLEDAEGRTVDMTMFKEEVFDLVECMTPYTRKTLFMRTYKPHKSKVRQGRAHHHTMHYRYSSKHHRYSRTLNTFEEFADDAEEMLTLHQMQCLKVKPKDAYARMCWGDDFWRTGPTGWKEHKNSRQWEAKQKRNSTSTWVQNVERHQITIEPDLYDPDQEEYDYAEVECFV